MGHAVAPSRGRGSKRCRSPRCADAGGRPLTGAWIETGRSPSPTSRTVSPPHGGGDRNTQGGLSHEWQTSRPLTGAWIETAPGRSGCQIRRSPPHGGVDRNIGAVSMAAGTRGRPLTGAWIETSSRSCRRAFATLVAPSRGRGSKLRGRDGVRRQAGRPLTGAWIETAQRRREIG